MIITLTVIIMMRVSRMSQMRLRRVCRCRSRRGRLVSFPWMWWSCGRSWSGRNGNHYWKLEGGWIWSGVFGGGRVKGEGDGAGDVPCLEPISACIFNSGTYTHDECACSNTSAWALVETIRCTITTSIFSFVECVHSFLKINLCIYCDDVYNECFYVSVIAVNTKVESELCKHYFHVAKFGVGHFHQFHHINIFSLFNVLFFMYCQRINLKLQWRTVLC